MNYKLCYVESAKYSCDHGNTTRRIHAAILASSGILCSTYYDVADHAADTLQDLIPKCSGILVYLCTYCEIDQIFGRHSQLSSRRCGKSWSDTENIRLGLYCGSRAW